MSDTLTNLQRALTHARTAHSEFTKAANVLAGGPADYYFEKITEYVEALFGRFAPFHEGERVRLTAAPDTSGNWRSNAHFMVTGAEGVVSGVDYSGGLFLAYVVFDDESWIDRDGMVRPPVNKHMYRISERILERMAHPVW